VFPVRYEPNSYILFRRNSVFKGLSKIFSLCCTFRQQWQWFKTYSVTVKLVSGIIMLYYSFFIWFEYKGDYVCLSPCFNSTTTRWHSLEFDINIMQLEVISSLYILISPNLQLLYGGPTNLWGVRGASGTF
jgi:hypothetical protein